MAKQSKKEQRTSKLESFKQLLAKTKNAGWVVCWSTNKAGQTHTQKTLKQALVANNMPEKLAVDILAKSAFSRACRKLETDRSIHIISREPPKTKFQFTAEFLDAKEEEWHFKKEGVVVLDEDTGKVTSRDPKLELLGQRYLDAALEERTTSDITRMVQRYIETSADLIPLRDSGAVYIVMEGYGQLLDNVHGFLNQLGGRLARIPLPIDDPHVKATVQQSFEDHFERLIEEHQKAVEAFTVSSRDDTLEREAERVKKTRLKIEAYMVLLGDRQEKAQKVVDAATKKCLAAIESIQKEKESMPAKEEGQKRDNVFGATVTGAIRWMKLEGWREKEAVAVLAELGIPVAMNTIKAQFYRAVNWKKGENAKGGVPAEFDAKSEKELNKLLKKVKEAE